MAKHRVGVLELHESPELCSPRIACGQQIAERIVLQGDARRIGKRLIQMARGTAVEAIRQAKLARDQEAILAAIPSPRGCWDGLLGVGNLVPFSKSHNPSTFPDKLHYNIPAYGDHRLRWMNAFIDTAPRTIDQVSA